MCTSVQTGPCFQPMLRPKETSVSPATDARVRANHLLAALPRAACGRIVAACEQVELAAGEVLMRPGAGVTHAWFPLEAIVSVRIDAPHGPRGLEVALVGPEGVVGVPLLLGATASTLRATVVKPGAALRIAAAPLRLELAAGSAFRRGMERYVLVSLAQMAQGILCTRFHRLDERLARWLLMTQDRAGFDGVPATHEFLAATLGVRRAGVTRAAAALQSQELIAYRRGVLAVLDREGLEAAACACYAADRATYAHVMQPPPG